MNALLEIVFVEMIHYFIIDHVFYVSRRFTAVEVLTVADVLHVAEWYQNSTCSLLNVLSIHTLIRNLECPKQESLESNGYQAFSVRLLQLLPFVRFIEDEIFLGGI